MHNSTCSSLIVLLYFFYFNFPFVLLSSASLISSSNKTEFLATDERSRVMKTQSFMKTSSKIKKPSIILVYPLENCKEKVTEAANYTLLLNSTIRSTQKKIKPKIWRALRNLAFSTLEKRVVEKMRSLRLPLSPGIGSNINVQPLSPNKPFHFPVSSLDFISPRLESLYLDMLQMEITQVPNFLTYDDIVPLAREIPCVLSVEEDFFLTSFNSSRRRYKVEQSSFFNEQNYSAFDSNLTVHNRFKSSEHFFCESDDPIDYFQTTMALEKDSSRWSTTDIRNLSNINKTSFSNTFDLTHNNSKTQMRKTLRISPKKSNKINDPWFSLQWYLKASEQYSANIDTLWNFWKGSPDMTIAIIDNGCEINHPDLNQNVWINQGEICGDGIDNDHNGYIDDCYGWDWVDGDNNPEPSNKGGHGTEAAGIIAAEMNNAIGITGVCPLCKIMCLRFIDDGGGYVSDEIAAFHYAVRMGAKILNNSFGSYGYSVIEFEAIKRLGLLGHIFVASAGNQNCNTDTSPLTHTPSTYKVDNIISVGASTNMGQKAVYSNYGRESVHVSAPGDSLITTSAGFRYSLVSGTSFAAPVVSGVIALIWSLYPELNFRDIKNSLIRSCTLTQTLNGRSYCNGVINAYQAALYCREIYIDNLINTYVLQSNYDMSEQSYKQEIREDYLEEFKQEQHGLHSLSPIKFILDSQKPCATVFRLLGLCSPSSNVEKLVTTRIREKNITVSPKSLQSLLQKIWLTTEKSLLYDMISFPSMNLIKFA